MSTRGRHCRDCCAGKCPCCAPTEGDDTGTAGVTYNFHVEGFADDIPDPDAEGPSITLETYASDLNGDYDFAPEDYERSSGRRTCSLNSPLPPAGPTATVRQRQVYWEDGVEMSSEEFEFELYGRFTILRECTGHTEGSQWVPTGNRSMEFSLDTEGGAYTPVNLRATWTDEDTGEPIDCKNLSEAMDVDPLPEGAPSVGDPIVTMMALGGE